jgi:hypothetical protein
VKIWPRISGVLRSKDASYGDGQKAAAEICDDRNWSQSALPYLLHNGVSSTDHQNDAECNCCALHKGLIVGESLIEEELAKMVE